MAVLAAPQAWAQPQLSAPGTLNARSVSDQFVVKASTKPGDLRVAADLGTNRNYVALEAALLPVACERLKQALYRELGETGPWSGKIFIGIYPISSHQDAITTSAEGFRDGWVYRVGMPNVVERGQYVRALVQVLLLERANRAASGHCPEIPLWLTTGLAEQLLHSPLAGLFVPRPGRSEAGILVTATAAEGRTEDPLSEAHAVLSTNTPLTFHQMSWPEEAELAGDSGMLFRACAQLLVHRLLSLKGGQAAMRETLDALPRYHNWQFAFLEGFREHFQRPLDVEKWWTLQTVHFSGRNIAQSWSSEESWFKLDQAIRSEIQVRLGTNDLPMQAETTLQTILREWEGQRQAEALQSKIQELAQLRLRLAPSLFPLVDDYMQVLNDYLQNREPKGLVLFTRKKTLQRRNFDETLSLLDQLDTLRLAVRPATKPPWLMLPADDARTASVQAPPQ
jgi:hypothetical protein